MSNISTLFGSPLYTVDIPIPLIYSSVEYIRDNIDTMTEVTTESTIGLIPPTYWTSYHSITTDNIPEICDKVIEHANIFSERLGIQLENKYKYWLNQWKGSNPECTNDRHSHTKSKIVGTLYITNNEPTRSTLRIENPAQNILQFTPYHDLAHKSWWKQIVDVDAPEYRLVLWPGFLWHWVNYTNNDNTHRISMAIEIN